MGKSTINGAMFNSCSFFPEANSLERSESFWHHNAWTSDICVKVAPIVCVYIFHVRVTKKRGFPKIGVPLKIICISRWEFPLQTIHYWGIAIDGHPHTRKRSWSFKIFKPSVQKFGLQTTCFRMNIFFFWSIQSRPPFVKMNSSFVIKIQSSDSQISQCTIIHEMTEYPEDHPHFSTFFPIFLAIPWGNSSMFPIGGPAHRWQPGRGFLWCSSSRPPGAGWRFVRRWNVKTAGNWTLSGHF